MPNASVTVFIQALPGRPDLPLPRYATEHAAGMDLPAAESVELPPGARAAVGTGIRMALPEGYEAQVRPRSGLALEHGITVLNSPGTIDADYRGEVKVILANLGDRPFSVAVGHRIAQLVVAPVTRVNLEAVEVLEDTARGEGGFGHTGVT